MLKLRDVTDDHIMVDGIVDELMHRQFKRPLDPPASLLHDLLQEMNIRLIHVQEDG